MPAGLPRSRGVWRALCDELSRLGELRQRDAQTFFERWFVPHLVSGTSGEEGLFTGYYEPELRGSRRRGGPYRIPLYVRPPDLVSVDLGEFRPSLRGERIAGRVINGRLKPYASRKAIDEGALDGRGLELVWVEDAVDAFFLHIQGSGRIALDDGSVIRVGYAATNGHPYEAIGRALIADGEMARDDVSMQSIRAWLAAHPEESSSLMQRNKSYVFFRELDGEGPIGAQGVALTPGRSLAVDRRFVPLGLPVWLDTRDPLNMELPLRRLLITQDTGGAIRGAVRGDVFWGHGPEAAERAGRMKSPGRYFLLLPRPGAGSPLS